MNDELNKNTPQLRFPEFEGEWVEKRLGQLGNFIGGGTPESTKKKYWEGNIPWISSSDIKEDNIQEINITRFITEEAINESATKIIPENSVLIVSRVGIGKFAVAKQDLCTSQDFTNLITNENSFFLAYYFKARSNRFVRLSQGTSIKGFTGRDIKSAKFSIPTQPEQTRIATFLTAVDKRINLLQKKKTQLEQYKKGVMQKIFSTGLNRLQDKQDLKKEEENHVFQKSIKSCSRLRFKQDNGNDFPDWEEKRLGEVCEIKMGQSPDSKSYNTNNNGLPLIQGNADISNRISNPRQWTNTPTKMCEVNDLILTVRAPVGAIAKSKHNACIGRGVCTIKNNKLSNLEYIYQLLLWYETKWISLEQGSTFTAVSGKDIRNLKFVIPNSLKEQQKIANFLSSIDKSIEKVGKQIEVSQQWKQGLLQKMFV